MDDSRVNCRSCGFGFVYEKIIGAIYDQCFMQPFDMYIEQLRQAEASDNRLQEYKVRKVHYDEPQVDWRRLERENPEVYKEFQPIHDKLDELEELETSYLTNGKLILSKGECPNCKNVGTLEFKPN